MNFLDKFEKIIKMDEKIQKLIQEKRPPCIDSRIDIEKLLTNAIQFDDKDWIIYSLYAGARILEKHYVSAIKGSRTSALQILCDVSPLSMKATKKLICALASSTNMYARSIIILMKTIYKKDEYFLRDIEEVIASYAVRFNSKEIIECIVKETGGVRLCLYKKPIILACERGNMEMLKMFSDQGADLHFNDCEPLRTAAKYGNKDIEEFLISLGSKSFAFKNLSNHFESGSSSSHGKRSRKIDR